MSETIPAFAGKDIGPENPDTAKARSSVYHLLSALFMKEVDSGLLAVMKSENIAQAFEELAPNIRCILDHPVPETLLNDLAEEYAALFVVPGGVPPYESVRLRGMINQQPAWEVEEFYRHCGLVMRDECRIMPDHIGMELDFMGDLAGKEAEARLNDDGEEAAKWLGLEREFFQNHIDLWVFAFLRDVERLAFHPFYKTVGSLAMRFLETEKEHLGIPKGGGDGGLPPTQQTGFQHREEVNHE
ncbi:MAG TPA: molecular chaperone TorD family protein [Nitrospirota bacterium]